MIPLRAIARGFGFAASPPVTPVQALSPPRSSGGLVYVEQGQASSIAVPTGCLVGVDRYQILERNNWLCSKKPGNDVCLPFSKRY